jgi:DNA-binding transcriptional MerR regulator
VRIGELSRLSGIPAATIKYYLREGLLPPGVSTQPNQAHYADSHLARLRLIRALIDIGGLSINTASKLLAVLDSPELGPWESVGKVQYALSQRHGAIPGPVHDENASRVVDELIARRGWDIRPGSPARRTLTDICATWDRLGHTDMIAALDDYAEAIAAVVAVDIKLITDQSSLAETIETVIVGTVIGDSMISALRQLTQEHVSRAPLEEQRTSQPSASNT